VDEAERPDLEYWSTIPARQSAAGLRYPVLERRQQPDFQPVCMAIYLDLYFTNPFVNARKTHVEQQDDRHGQNQGRQLRDRRRTDHITPWKGVHKTAQIMGEGTTFVLSNSGHLQSLINPPTNPKVLQ